MSPKAQHSGKYQKLPVFLKNMREKAGLSQREIGKILNKPQSWVYNCEVLNRRVDVAEFILWSKACKMDPLAAFRQFLDEF